MTRTPWTQVEYDELIVWHESVIVQYPAELVEELRRGRGRFLASVRVLR